MNCQKFTQNQASNILVHCNRSEKNRTYGNQKIDTDKSYLNYNLAPKHDMSDFEFMKKRCEELKILKRKDINWMASWITTIPKDYIGNEKDFFIKSYDFFENKYGKENVISSYVHFDETSPHMHFTFVPVVYDKKKETYKVNAKQCITKYDLQKIHTEMQNYLEKELSTKVNLLNGATINGNQSIDQLKQQSDVKQTVILELIDNPTTEIINKVVQEKVSEFQTEEKLNITPVKQISDIDKLGKKEARQELKIKVDEIDLLQQQNQKLYEQNKRFCNSLFLADELQHKNKELQMYVSELKEENYTLKSEYQKLQKKYNKLQNVFEYFINTLRNVFISIQNIFTPRQKQENEDLQHNIEYLSVTDTKTIVNDFSDSFDKEEQKKRQRDYDLEL